MGIKRLQPEDFEEKVSTITTKNMGKLNLISKYAYLSCGYNRKCYLIKCPICGKERWIAAIHQLESMNCKKCANRISIKKSCHNRGINSFKWKGGYISKAGYIMIPIYPDNPYYETSSGYTRQPGGMRKVRLHRILMASYLGRNLKTEDVVHHRDGNKLNNNIDNLELMTPQEHMKIHSKNNFKEYNAKRKLRKLLASNTSAPQNIQSPLSRNASREDRKLLETCRL